MRIEASAAPVLEPDASESVKISRSGRVVKRSSFHDEMEEGEQHLRTTRKDESGEDMLPTYEEIARGYTVEDELGRDDEDDLEEVARPIRTKVIKPPNTLQPQVPLPSPPAQLQGNPAQTVLPMAVETLVSPDPGLIPKVSNPTISSEATDSVADAAALAETPKTGSVPDAVGATSSQGLVRPTPVRTFPSGGDVAAPSAPPTEPSIPMSGEALNSPEAAAKPSSTSQMPPLGAKIVKEAVGGSDGVDGCHAGPPYKVTVDVNVLVKKAIANIPLDDPDEKPAAPSGGPIKVPRRKPGARECMQISRRFGNRVIPKKYMDILMDYCTRGKVEHLIRMRERLDEHALYLESQLAGLESLVREKGETTVVVPPLPDRTPLDPLLVGGATKSYSPVNGGPAGSTCSAAPPSPVFGGSGAVPSPPRLCSSTLQEQKQQLESTSSGPRSSPIMVVPPPSHPASLSSSSTVAVSTPTEPVGLPVPT